MKSRESPFEITMEMAIFDHEIQFLAQKLRDFGASGVFFATCVYPNNQLPQGKQKKVWRHQNTFVQVKYFGIITISSLIQNNYSSLFHDLSRGQKNYLCPSQAERTCMWVTLMVLILDVSSEHVAQIKTMFFFQI